MTEAKVTMKVTLDKLTVTKLEVEIPTICPECDTDFTHDGRLHEHQLLESYQECTVINGVPDEHGAYKDGTEPYFTTGYSCAVCGYILCTTEGT